MSSPPRRAVVLGGSLAGLCAAHVLARHVDRVTVVERDRYPDGPHPRKGVPQAFHLHVLIAAGQRDLDRLFPGLTDELYAHGAVPIAVPTDILYQTPTGWRERFPATHSVIGVSRELIDWAVHRRVAADDRIEFLTGHDAVGLLPAEDGTAGVGGVALAPRPGVSGVRRLDADLVVDASGRGSHAPDWLAALGHGRPRETRVDSGLGYTSRRYRIPTDAIDGWRNVLLLPRPPELLRAGVLAPIENGRWIVTIGGIGEANHAPTDDAGFVEFARTLASPLIYDVIRDAEPDGPARAFRQTANRRLHFDAMPTWPDGFLVVGDAACAFNPVYGQGMAVAAATALALDEHLARHRGRFGRPAQKLVAARGDAAWMVASGADKQFLPPGTVRITAAERVVGRYLERVGDVANRDPHVCEVYNDVLHLLAPPAALLRPGVALRVLRGRPGPALTAPPLTTSPRTVR